MYQSDWVHGNLMCCSSWRVRSRLTYTGFRGALTATHYALVPQRESRLLRKSFCVESVWFRVRFWLLVSSSVLTFGFEFGFDFWTRYEIRFVGQHVTYWRILEVRGSLPPCIPRTIPNVCHDPNPNPNRVPRRWVSKPSTDTARRLPRAAPICSLFDYTPSRNGLDTRGGHVVHTRDMW